MLKAEAELGHIVGEYPNLYFYMGLTEQANLVFLIARNPHLASVTVSSFGLNYKRPMGDKMIIFHQPGYEFPYEVVGGKELVQWIEIEKLLGNLRQLGRRPSDLKWVWFQASSGKVFRDEIDSKVIIALEKAFQTLTEVTEKDKG